MKQICRGGGAKITERSIKDSCENGGRAEIPSPSTYFPRYAVAIGTEGVVIEGEGCFVCTEVYVGFGSGGHKGKGYVGVEILGRGVFILLC